MLLSVLLSTEIKGNAFSDQDIFNKVDQFINEVHPVEDKAQVIEWMETKVMGCDSTRNSDEFPTDEIYVQTYIDGC